MSPQALPLPVTQDPTRLLSPRVPLPVSVLLVNIRNFSVVSTLFYQLGRPMRLLYSEHQDGISGGFVPSQDALLVNQDCTPISTHPSGQQLLLVPGRQADNAVD